MNSIKNLKNGGIPRPYSRLNCVKDLEANYKHSQNEEELKEGSQYTQKIKKRESQSSLKQSSLSNKLEQNISSKRNFSPVPNQNANANKILEPVQRNSDDNCAKLLNWINTKKNKEHAFEENSIKENTSTNILSNTEEEKEKISKEFKIKALKIAYRSLNKNQFRESKKKYNFVIYLKGIKGTRDHIKTEKVSQPDSNKIQLNTTPSTCLKDNLSSINLKNPVINTESSCNTQYIHPSQKHQNISKNNSRVSLMVSSFEGSSTINRIHDIYTIDKLKHSTPQLAFRRCNQLSLLPKSQIRKHNKRQSNYNSQQGKSNCKIICKKSIYLPVINSRNHT